ncbi:site-specific integrase [Allomuricauda taeanensis]|uniref:site-specific integrase n=1 Tax=Flagellimonas taeanensis TaxID=1005926 RepID=UPI002E7C1191|nr:site-specific integrase [Allomuricauda taeanensis]MEE1961995.1 site-specific integrase [Allomuricauda taeanensis]
MGKAKFKLKEPNSKNETLVNLVFYYNYKRFKYSTGEKIEPKFWNLKNERAKESKQFPQYPEFNSRLDVLENGINTAYRRLLNDGVQPNNQLLKTHLEAELSGKILETGKKSLFGFIDEFIKESKFHKKKSTIIVYNTVFKYLKEFAASQRKKIDFESIDLEFYNKYLKYLVHDRDLSSNTVGKHVKTLKTFMNEATERGYNKNMEYKKRKFRVTKEESDAVYLNVDELKKIEEADLSASPNLDRTKDLFLIGCYTGLRFSDFTQIKPENIDHEKSILQIRTQKTGQRVSIPLHPTVKRIIQKYNGELPRAYVNQVMNKYLKDVASISGLKQMVQITMTKGGQVQKNSCPKYELVTTHTARRSFATNLYLADVPSISIMKITGHKTERSFMQYIKISQEQNADKLLNHPFFS